jgi:hypothetical protein
MPDDEPGQRVVASVRVSAQCLSRTADDLRRATKVPVRPEDIGDMLVRVMVREVEERK